MKQKKILLQKQSKNINEFLANKTVKITKKNNNETILLPFNFKVKAIKVIYPNKVNNTCPNKANAAI